MYRSRPQRLLVIALAVLVVGAIILVTVQDRSVTFSPFSGLLFPLSPTNATRSHHNSVTSSPTPPSKSGVVITASITANVTMYVSNADRTPVTVRPERVIPHADVSNVYVSILTVPKLHGSRLSYQLMSWIQSFKPQQVGGVTLNVVL